MRKSYLACIALIIGVVMVLPTALPTGAASNNTEPVAWVNSFNYENQQGLPVTDGGHVISVNLLPDGTTMGCVKVYDRLTGMELNSTGFDQTATKFWKENGARVAEFVVFVRANEYAPPPYRYLYALKYQVWDHDESGMHDWHRVWGSLDGITWFPPTDYIYVLGYAQVNPGK